MYLCFHYPGVPPFCYWVPRIGPIYSTGARPQEPTTSSSAGYSGLIQDASIVASFQEALNGIADAGVCEALRGGIQGAVQALQKRAGEHITIRLDS
jgi:hypothetical protein